MKIGFIDKYLDEWHANKLPTWLRDETDDIEEIYAYEMMPSPNDGGISGYGALRDKKGESVRKNSFAFAFYFIFPSRRRTE